MAPLAREEDKPVKWFWHVMLEKTRPEWERIDTWIDAISRSGFKR
jgi:hypothetical protein